ncbi:MAG: hypothetical protein RL375_3352 [Pseudomonadota bacterium]|jgi:hypothetical protein
MTEPDAVVYRHEFDDDACCVHCGFDGAEWHHWKHNTHEGRSQPEAKQPICTVPRRPVTDNTRAHTMSHHHRASKKMSHSSETK